MSEEFKSIVEASYDKGTPFWIYTSDYIYGMIPSDGERWVEISYTFEDPDEPLVKTERNANLSYQFLFFICVLSHTLLYYGLPCFTTGFHHPNPLHTSTVQGLVGTYVGVWYGVGTGVSLGATVGVALGSGVSVGATVAV